MDCQKCHFLTSKRSENGQVFSKRYNNFFIILYTASCGHLLTLTFLKLFVYSFLWMILINCQEIDLIELFKGHFQGRKGQVWPISHNYQYYSVVMEVLPKFIVSCSFFVVKPIQS